MKLGEAGRTALSRGDDEPCARMKDDRSLDLSRPMTGQSGQLPALGMARANEDSLFWPGGSGSQVCSLLEYSTMPRSQISAISSIWADSIMNEHLRNAGANAFAAKHASQNERTGPWKEGSTSQDNADLSRTWSNESEEHLLRSGQHMSV